MSVTLRDAYRPVQQPVLARVLVRTVRAHGGHGYAPSPIGGEGFDTGCMLAGACTCTGDDVGGTA